MNGVRLNYGVRYDNSNITEYLPICLQFPIEQCSPRFGNSAIFTWLAIRQTRPKSRQNPQKFTRRKFKTHNHSKWASIVLIFQYVVYEDFSDLMQKFRKNPCMAKWIFEALNNTLFYELFIVKNGGIYFVEVKVGRFSTPDISSNSMYRGNSTFRLVCDASSLEILHFLQYGPSDL